jgi:CubicO group peptidase (beta-lactamase class C family)
MRFVHRALLLLLIWPAAAWAETAAAIDAYLTPYVASNNFPGNVFVRRGSTVLFEKSYGFADRERQVANRSNTRFHVASLSILFTSTAVLRLIDQGRLSFDTHVSEIVPQVPNGEKITIRHLLEQNSGMPDSDDLPPSRYDELIAAHQTPESVVTLISALPPHAEPGGKSEREEHTGQALLALIIERKTGFPFAQAMRSLVFEPFGMRDSGIDDDSALEGPHAKGYQVAGSFGLKLAPTIHWSAKPGHGSAYSTASDVAKWLVGVRHGNLLSEGSMKALFGPRNGYGWELDPSARFGETAYFSAGRGPGFSSFLEYLPHEDVTIITLTNVEHGTNGTIVDDIAALLQGKAYKPLRYQPTLAPLAELPTGDFVFGPDFYRASATLKLVANADGLTLDWPGGPAAGLLPIERDKFIDRYYWTAVSVVRGPDGKPAELEFGKFKGTLRSGGGAN